MTMCQYCKPDYYCAVGSGGAICTHLDGLTYMHCPVYVWLSSQLRSVESQILDSCSNIVKMSENFLDFSFGVVTYRTEIDAPF